jgi:ferric-dicitrate binding protein FerR (iron transport regulator)
VLTAGHSITVEKNIAIDSSQVVVSKPEWTSNELSFTKETLQNITEELERQYNISIKIKDIQNINNLFTGILPSNNLKAALNSLEKAFQLKTIITSKKDVILEKK